MVESVNESGQIAARILSMPGEELSKITLFERLDLLESMGLLAHETQCGYPERPLEVWTKDELRAVVEIFKTWPQEAEYADKLKLMEDDFVKRFSAQTASAFPAPNRKKKIEIAAKCFSESCREVLDFKDFPDINIVFAPCPFPGDYAMLRPDGKTQICSRNLTRNKVEESQFSGDLSSVELVLHEAMHKLQSYMADRQKEHGPKEFTNMRVAEAFYEATDQLKNLNRDVYFQHPFESQARDVAHKICAKLKQQSIDLPD
jgi:DNA-binding HxlR family transcriptional regulator